VIHPQGSALYFPEAFLLKTTPSVLLLLAWVPATLARRSGGRSFDGWFLFMPAALYFAVAVGFGLNIGHRHLLPVYPLIFVASGSAPPSAPGSTRNPLLPVLLCGQAASALSAYPGSLSYFNLTAGGSDGACKRLVDSNVDWGQDLGRLKAWMDAEAVPDIHLA